MAQLIECRPTNEGVDGAIPSRRTCPGCGPGPHWGNHTLTFLSLSFSFPSPLSENK